MKIGVISENLIEQFALQQQLVPIPCMETQESMILARVITVATRDDLGTNAYDVVFMSNLIHHFDESTNIALFRRVSKALRPGGCFVVQKLMFPDKEQGQGGAFLNLFFAMTSAAGNWSFKTIEQWQREAGLVPQKTINFRTTPATGQQVAIKP